MINEKEKLWFGTILVATVVLSIYLLVIMENHIPAIQQNLLDSQETIASMQEHNDRQNAMLEVLQTDLKSIYENLAEKTNLENQTLAIKSVCHGLQGVSDAEALRQQGKLPEAVATLNDTKELFWKAGDVLTAEQKPLRDLMSPIDNLKDKWGKGDKTAEANKLAMDVKAVIRKVDKYAEFCPTGGKTNTTITEKHIPSPPLSDEKHKVAIATLCNGFQLITAAEKSKQDNPYAAADTLKVAKEPIWQASEALMPEQKALRDLMAPIDVLMSRWKNGDKAAESAAISATVKGIMQTAGVQPEACAPPLLQVERQNDGIKALCNGYQLVAQAEQYKQDNPNAAADTLKAAKEPIWQASDILMPEQKALRDLMAPIDALISQWKSGDKAPESKSITATVKSILQAAGTQPEACPPLAEGAFSTVVFPIQTTQIPVQATSSFSAPTSIIVTYEQPQQFKTEIASITNRLKAITTHQEAHCTPKPHEKPAEACSFTSFQGDYTPQGSIHCLWKSLEKINHAETKRRAGDLQAAARLIKTAKQLIWRSGDILVPEQNALGSLMMPIDTVATNWEKGDKKSETSKITSKLTEILHRLDKKPS